MNRVKVAWAAIGAVAMMGLASQAFANASASGSLSDLTWAAVDLRPEDGVDPGSASEGAQALSEVGMSSVSSRYETETERVEGLLPPIALSMNSVFGSSSSAIDMDGLRTHGAITAPAPDVRPDLAAGGVAIQNVTLLLSPWTGLRVSARARLDASTSVMDDDVVSMYGWSLAWILIGAAADDDYSDVVVQEAYASDNDMTSSFEGLLELSYDNASPDPLQVVLTFQQDTYAFVERMVPPPIPEPASHLLLVAGLPAVFALVRRRTRIRPSR
jgi:hypothetical protein